MPRLEAMNKINQKNRYIFFKNSLPEFSGYKPMAPRYLSQLFRRRHLHRKWNRDLKKKKKLDGVGPVDNRPSTD